MMLPQLTSSRAPCCQASGRRTAPTRPRRGWDLAAGAAALSIWAVVPKCPLCLAAHLAIWTGLGLSLTQATLLRWTLLGAGAGLLAWAVLRQRRPSGSASLGR